jgi:hypothetical protein
LDPPSAGYFNFKDRLTHGQSKKDTQYVDDDQSQIRCAAVPEVNCACVAHTDSLACSAGHDGFGFCDGIF